MKKALSAVIRILSALYAFLPVCSLTAYCFGYTFSLFSYTFFSVTLAVVSIIAVVWIFKKKENTAQKADIIMLAFLPLLSLINWAVYLFKSREPSVIALCMPICFVCSVIPAANYIKPSIPKIISITLSFIILIPLAFSNILFLFWSPLRTTNTVDIIPSPSGSHYAEIVDSDQGALGGDTLVYVCENGGIDLIVFSITKSPKRIYAGEWREYEAMQIYWKNNNCLVINTEKYFIE